jgi:hypothetical protein
MKQELTSQASLNVRDVFQNRYEGVEPIICSWKLTNPKDLQGKTLCRRGK